MDVSFGVAGPALSWIHSYLSRRYQSVGIGRHRSAPTELRFGVPQGSVLGPFLFSIYTSPIAHIAQSFSVLLQQYADDTQLFISLSPTNTFSDISRLVDCLQSLSSWFLVNGLCLNPGKSECLLLGTQQRSLQYRNVASVDVAGTAIPIATSIKTLGVRLDSHLTMNDHVSDVCRSSFYHIRSLRQLRPAITDVVAKEIAAALVGARLDYCNSILHGVSQYNINRLQRVQHTLARVVLGRSPVSATTALQLLHWLPVTYRIKYKLAKLTYLALHGDSPRYLAELITPYRPTRALRSIDAKLLVVPAHKTNFGSRAFRIAAPTIWNSLPQDIRDCLSLPSFCNHLKTFYFQSAFLVAA